MSLLEQDTTKKRQVDENATELAELNANNNKSGKYKVEAICDSAVYIKKSAYHLPRLYYLISWKYYLEKKIPKSLHQLFSTLKSSLARSS